MAEKLQAVEIKPGDRVRSYDFEVSRNCYVEGVVEEITPPIEGCPRYKIRAERRVWEGQEETLPDDPESRCIYPPVNGTPKLFGGVTAGVEKLG